MPCLACVGLLLVNGCATFVKIVNYNEKGVYGNRDKTFQVVSFDTKLLELMWIRDPAPLLTSVIMTPFWLLDIPISLVADILMLPLDLYWDAANDERAARNIDSNETPDPQ